MRMATKQAKPPAKTKRAATLVILSSKAGSMTPQIEAKIRKAFD